jgi:hypothetical protein
MSQITPRVLMAGGVAVLAACSGLFAQDAAAWMPLHMTAFAVNLSGVGRARPQTLQIVIERWSSDEERKKLVDTLVEKGGEKLVDVVQDIKPRAGYIRTTTSLGWDIQYARESPLPSGGRRVVFVTDRPISFREARENTRSADYEFMVCEIRLGPDGKGEGRLAAGTKITYDRERRQVELENYGQQPVRLTQVRVDK